MTALLYCGECGRRLLRAAFSMPTKDGVLSFGPKCAARFVIKPKRARMFTVRKARPKRDTGQGDLFGGTA